MSRGQSQPRTQLGSRTLDRCIGKSQSENVVVIDVEDDDSDPATIIGVSESSRQRLEDSNVMREDNKLQPMSITIISIDDDEEDFSARNDNEAGGEESDGDECDFIWREMSKWKQSYYGERLFRNHFGLNPDFESSSSESDSSDCEIMGGSDGKIHEQWEKASLKRKRYEDVRSGQTGSEDQVSASGSNSDTQKDFEVENTAERHGGAPTCFSSSNSDEVKEDKSTSKASGANIKEDPFFDLDEYSPIGDSAKTADRGSPSWCKTQSSSKSQFSHKEGGWQSFFGTELESESGINCNGASLRDRKQVPGRHFGTTRDGQIQYNYGRHSFKEKEENIPAESCSFYIQPGKKTCFNHNNHQLDETEITQDTVFSWVEEEGIFGEPSLRCTQLPNDTEYRRELFEEKKQPFFEEPTLFNTQSYDDEVEIIDVEIFTECNDESIFCVTFPSTALSLENMRVSQPFFEEPTLFNTQSYDDEVEIIDVEILNESNDEPIFCETFPSTALSLENMRVSQPQDERDSLLHDQDWDFNHHVQKDFKGEREKFKETSECKVAAEEESASRQQQLRIQSEEAMRFRKRKEVETLRLLDVERRQKQRVEEMREMKKKDEESINLKEEIRIEVRNELDKLEMQSSDMASLLRIFGIYVEGGLSPMPHEVHAAYKKALLRFHPDRASRTDLRQQVEAEEKFKLISRSKEKLLPAS